MPIFLLIMHGFGSVIIIFKKENMSRSRVLFIGCERRITYLWLTILFYFILRPTFIELSLIFCTFQGEISP